VSAEPVSRTLHDTHVSVSIGIAVQIGSTTLHDLTERADKALYEAKAQGRDRVAVAALAVAVPSQRAAADHSAERRSPR
jgi:GGDEF domain-containing protein